MAESLPVPDLDRLLASWLRELRGQRKSPHTLRGYRAAVQSFLDFCAQEGLTPELTKPNVIHYMATRDGEVSSARLQLTTLKIFARWLAAQDEVSFDADPIIAIRPPRLDQRTVPDLSESELRRLIKACDGRALRDKRDKALLVLFAETGLRAAEMVALDITDVNVDDCVVNVQLGKGRKGRRVRFSVGAAAILDRYLRARDHAVRRPAEGPLWIGANTGKRLTYTGMAAALKLRARDAGVHGFHIHRLRHTAATRWLKSGGSETGLLAHAGWKSTVMIDRYVKAASEQLAGEEFDRLNLGLVDL